MTASITAPRLTVLSSDSTKLESWGLGYRMTCAGDGVRFTVSRCRDDHGELSCELTVTALGGADGHIFVGKFNVSSLPARRTTAAHLNERHRGVDWLPLLERLCMLVLGAARRPATPIELSDVPQDSGDLVLPPLLLARHPTIIFGDGGTGKSLIALGLTLALEHGAAFAGMRPTRPVRVAYLDWEGAFHSAMVKRMQANRSRSLYLRMEHPLTDQVESLTELIHDENIEFIVVDSAVFACDGPPEESASAMRFFRALSQLRVGSLIIAHNNKLGDESKPFGSVFWHNGARLTWYAKKQQEINDESMVVALVNRKANFARLSAPIGLRLDFSPAAAEPLRRVDAREVPDLASHLPLRYRIEGALRDGAKTYQELADLLELDVDTVSRTARRSDGKSLVIFTNPEGRKVVGLKSKT